MAADPPSPPTDIPTELVDQLRTCSPEQLQAIAEYAADLAAHQTQTDEPTAASADTPDDVPSKATVTTKEINDNRYHYWQWREGDKIKSKYKGPADSQE